MSFKPIAALLLIPVILATAILTAAVLGPPFAAAGLGVREISSRLDAMGADFTRIPRFPERSTIYAADGSVLTTVYLDNREVVPLSAIAQPAQRGGPRDRGLGLLRARRPRLVVVDPRDDRERAPARSSRAAPRSRSSSSGARSTCSRASTRASRASQELALAIRVEQRYSKERIFELYLNQVYMGNGVYGFGTASEFYFRKPARELTLLEGATLAGMVRAPEYYDPLDRPKKMLLRRNDVLNRMAALGWITDERNEKLKARPLRLPKDAGKLVRSTRRSS